MFYNKRTKQMENSNTKTGNQSQKRNWLFPASVALIAISSAVVVSCFHDDDPAVTASATDTLLPTEPAPITVTGNSLLCDSSTVTASTLAADTVALADADSEGVPKHNISFDVESGDDTNPASWNNHNSGNNLKRLGAVVAAQKPDGSDPTDQDGSLLDIGDVHPIVVSYGEQVIGGFEGGDGSADIGDPDNVDDIFVSLSLDNGISWRKDKVGDTAKNSSKSVSWDSQNIPYPGHSHKPTMAIQGNNILVAWNDKYCPSGNPFDLEDPATEDYYKVNGSQGTVDYGGILAPNGKLLYEVPYSCVWTARGVFSDTDLDTDNQIEIVWRQAQQLTSGTRDSNKIWIAPAEVGFAITWQEDPDGLRPGKGEGPGDGYSGATTNHGADIWYTYIRMEDFTDVCTEFDAEGVCTTSIDDEAAIAILGEKPKPAVNFTYPVRVTNNDTCTPDDTKLYCADNCVSTIGVTSNNQSGTIITRCVQNDLDYMTSDATISPAAAILDGDTGASRPALKILKTNAAEPEFVAILAYEETKGLSESDPADQGDTDTDIALEGKAVYFESFFWDQPVTVSAGRIVNMRVPGAEVADDGSVSLTGLDIYENARRVVILPQVDACEMQDGDPTFAIMYKQGYDTQGGPSDMFIRVNYGFTYDDFGQLDSRDVTNVSSHANTNDPYDAEAGTGAVVWTTTNLEDQSYTYPLDNTFSPRGWLRGGEVYIGFEYSPLWRATSVGTVPNNFWMHSFVDSTWNGPKQLSLVTGQKVSTLDPRFIPTPKGSTALPSDASNPDVIFMSYGTFDMLTGEELDLLYMRSTDKGVNWEYLDSNGETVLVDSNPATSDGIPGTDDDNAARGAKLAAIADVHEMEVQGLASPDGTMLFNAWLEESAGPVDLDNQARYGLESRFGLVEYAEPVLE
jgi:hypothetical protein